MSSVEFVEKQKVRSPWRRYFARMLDATLYTTLWILLISLIPGVILKNRGSLMDIVDIIVAMIIMYFLEPLLLSRFGTTFGKWIWGLSVTHEDGSFLSYSDARERTGTVLWRGMGLNIPIYNLYRLWKSYKACSEGELLDWDWEHGNGIQVNLKDEKKYRIALFIVAHILFFGILFIPMYLEALAPNRGDLTVADFAENYNYFAQYHQIGTEDTLGDDGAWVESDQYNNYYTIISGGNDPADFQYTVEDGVMTGLEFSLILEDSEDLPPSYYTEMVLSALAFIQGQEEYPILALGGMETVLDEINDHRYQSYQTSTYGVTLTCEVDYEGYYQPGAGYMWPKDDAEHCYYQFHFQMTKD